jgi:hypothetical protein
MRINRAMKKVATSGPAKDLSNNLFNFFNNAVFLEVKTAAKLTYFTDVSVKMFGNN